MSYCIQQTEQSFEIEALLMPEATKALRLWSSQFETKQLGTCPSGSAQKVGLLSFEKLMEEVGFNVDYGDDGGVIGMMFVGDKLFDNLDVVLKVLAPSVTEGSYLQFCGEGTDTWRYVFEDGKMTEKTGEVSFK